MILTAALFWGVVGAGLAGTYMPGLQVLNARLTESSASGGAVLYILFWHWHRRVLLFERDSADYFDHKVAAWLGAIGAFVQQY